MSFNNNDKKRDEQIFSDFLFGVSDKMKNFETDNSKNIKRFKKHMGRVVEDVSDFIEDKTEKVKSSYENNKSESESDNQNNNNFNPFRDFDLFSKAEDLFNFGKDKPTVNSDESDNRPTYAPKQKSNSEESFPNFSDLFNMFGDLGKETNKSSSSKDSTTGSDALDKIYRMMSDGLREDFLNSEKDERSSRAESPVEKDFDKSSETKSQDPSYSSSAEEVKVDVKADKAEDSHSENEVSTAEFVYGELNKKLFNNERPAVVLDSDKTELMNEIVALAAENGAQTVKLSTADEDDALASKMTLSYFLNLQKRNPGFAIVSVDARENDNIDVLKDLIGELLTFNRSRMIYVVITVKGQDKVKEVHQALGNR